MVIFHSYVSLPEGIRNFLPTLASPSSSSTGGLGMVRPRGFCCGGGAEPAKVAARKWRHGVMEATTNQGLAIFYEQ